MNNNQSRVYQVLEHIYDGSWQATAKSFQRLNTALKTVLDSTISAGLEFHEDDFSSIYKDFKGSYWFGVNNDSNMGEHFFAAAVEVGNTSACISFEKWANRKPFTIDNCRIFIGRDFQWKGERVVCTSFDSKGEFLIACSYNTYYRSYNNRCYGEGKPKKRFKITQDDLKAYRAEQKAKVKEAKLKEEKKDD